MKKPTTRILITAALALTLALIAPPISASPKGGKGKGGNNGGGPGSGSEQVSVTPNVVYSPVTADDGFTVCLSGFSAGNFVAIQVPYVGTPDSHSLLAFSRYIDSSGGLCLDSPPDWATLDLEPGSYRIQVVWYKDGRGGKANGLSVTLEVY